MSPEQKKEWPWRMCQRENCPYSHNPKRKHKLDNNKGKGKGDGKAARTPSPKRDGVCYAWREKGNSANTSTLNQHIRSCA